MNIVGCVPFVSVSSLKRPVGMMLAGVSTCVAMAGVAMAQTVPANQTAQTYYERSFVLAADRKCNLFEQPIGQALGAAALQTRGTLLREGHDPRDVTRLERQAEGRADATACADSELGVVQGRIEHAFGRWSRAARIDFPAKDNGWVVDRFSGSQAGWRVMQQSRVGGSPVRFGLMGKDPADMQAVAVVSFIGRSRPYAARLVLRDEAVLPRPLLVEAGRAVVPPLSGRKTVFASRQTNAAQNLLERGQRQGEAWLFPHSAIKTLETLDPREEFWVEFLFRDDTVARVQMEVGDLTAAQAFLGLGLI